MRNIFNVIFILIIGYIISKVFFNSTSSNKPIDHFDTLVPSPAPTSSLEQILSSAPGPTPGQILSPAFAPSPDLVQILSPAFAPSSGPSPAFAPAPDLVQILSPAFAPAPGLSPAFAPAPGLSPAFAPAPGLSPAFAPAPGPSPFMINGINMSDYTANYYSLFNRKINQGSSPSPPSFYMFDLPFLSGPSPAPTAQNTISVIKKITPEQDVRSTIGTVKFNTEFSKIYPIGTNFDPVYSNYSTLISNTSIGLLNEILAAAKFKANQNSQIINFNSGLKQVKSVLVQESDVTEYAKYLVSLMNTVSSVGNSFVFVKANPIVKEQYENQLRLNFTIETIYKYPKSANPVLEIAPSDFTLLLNVVMLFEKSYSNPTTQTYLETFGVLGLSNFGYLAGYSKSKK
jgi:hypothetical protein